MDTTNDANEIFYREGYGSVESFMIDSALLIALSKIDQYESECDSFKDKYGMALKDFELFLRREKGMEIFEKEEDLDDWEFAAHALKWWKEKADELRDSKPR
jgi:hypothetical protein